MLELYLNCALIIHQCIPQLAIQSEAIAWLCIPVSGAAMLLCYMRCTQAMTVS